MHNDVKHTAKHLISVIQEEGIMLNSKHLSKCKFWSLWCSKSRSCGLWRCTCCLHLHLEDGGSMYLWNFCILPQHYNVSQPRKPQLNLFKYYADTYSVNVCSCLIAGMQDRLLFNGKCSLGMKTHKSKLSCEERNSR